MNITRFIISDSMYTRQRRWPVCGTTTPGWKPLRSIPFLGDVRTAQLLAIIATRYRFRTKRNLWPYAGLAVVTRSIADQDFAGGQLRRRAKAPRTRGLNRNHNPDSQIDLQKSAHRRSGEGRSTQRDL